MRIPFTLFLLMSSSFLAAQITIDIHPNFKHTIEGVDSFNRKKMIKIHADQTEPDWSNGNNFGNNACLLDTFLNGLDVYMGRNTGGISWYVNQVKEDLNRKGFADSTDLTRLGLNARNSYASQPELHPYESRNELVIAAQQIPFYPDGTKTRQGWAFANGSATGEYMGRYINEFFGKNSRPIPPLVEIMNEPLYMFTTRGNTPPAEIFQFHNEAADAIRAQNPNVLIGGYCVAFPNFEENNFQRWHDRWKLFMDMSGERMDFWSIHTYDFNLSWSNTPILRRGANLEATLDMIEHYSKLSFNEVKPFVISEYGGRALTLEANAWSPYRDWLTMKSMTSMLLTFSERPQLILSAIPFIIVKAEWGRQEDGDPYPWRLMRQNKELPGQTGDHWVYTELVKFYQLWSEVKGSRIDTKSTDPDIQTNAFVDGNKMYLILNNLNFKNTPIHLNLVEKHNNPVEKIKVKHLYLNESLQVPVLDEIEYESLDSLDIGAEGSAVIEYTFTNEVFIDQMVEEKKYYAEEHLTPIITNAEHEFHINEVHRGSFGEAILRLGMGRPHETSLTPIVKINGREIEVPANYMGYDQLTRDSWFGVIDIPVPFALIEPNNIITVQYPDKGGHISSMALRIFNHSELIQRTNAVNAQSITLEPSFKQLEPNQEYTFLATFSPMNAAVNSFVWTSSDEEIAIVDSLGRVTALAIGETIITVSTPDGKLKAGSTVEVIEQAAPVLVNSLEVNPDSFTLGIGDLIQMQAKINPTDAADKSIKWTSSDPSIAAVDSTGLVLGQNFGEAQIIGSTKHGGLSDTSVISVIAPFQTFLNCTLLPDELLSETEYDIQVEYSAGERLDIAVELKDPNDRWVGEGRVTVEPGVGIANIKIKNVSTSDWTTPVFPVPASGYAFRVWIRKVGGDWTTNSGGCSKFDIEITSNTTSIIPLELSNLKIYPNPTSGKIFLELPGLKEKVNATIFNHLGQQVLQQNIIQKNSWINIEHLRSGMYLITLSTLTGNVTQRIVLN